MKKKILIAGKWRGAAENFEVISPFTGEMLAEVCSVNSKEISEIIGHASDAAAEMRLLARYQIAKGLRNIAAGIKDRRDEFAQTIVKESAKPINIAVGEVERSISTFNLAASEAERFCGEIVPVDAQSTGNGKIARTMRTPKGIIYGITPFNFPLNLVAHKVAPALASGNSIIIKPSEKTPLTSLLLGEVFLESGFPKAALQVVPMDVKYMDAVLSDERIKMISFTGSDKVGWMLKEKAGKKSVALELGGNAPVIVDESANIETAIEKITIGAFAYSGQVCISIQRVLLHEKLAEEFTNKLVEKAMGLKMGDPFDTSTQLSVMIDENSAIRASKWIDEAVQGGANLLCGGNRVGAMLDATILNDVDNKMRIVSEEAFAPVAVIETFTDFRQGIELANDSKYGLQVGVFTNDLENSQYAAENLEYGGIIINDVPTFRVDNMPYGGMKDSGFGREGVRYAMEEMSEIRLIVLNS